MKACLSLLSLPAALLLGACGEPTVQAPAPLEVSYMPLDGAIGVSADVIPQVVFTGEVDAATVGPSSALLASAAPDAAEGCADVSYENVTAVPALDGERPQVLLVPQEGGGLTPGMCYRLTLTTALRGVDLGPLQGLGLPDRPDVGAEAYFETADPP